MTEILADTMIYKIVADKSDFDKKIDEVEKRIDTLEKKVTFKADTSQVEKSIDEINQKEVRPKADFEELKKGFVEVKAIARDTGVELDKEHILKLNTDIAEKQLQLQEFRGALKDITDKEQKIELKSNINLLSKEITEAQRRLNNYMNTGDETLSRFKSNFNNIGGIINNFSDKVGNFFGSLGKGALNIGKLIAGGLGFTSLNAVIKKGIQAIKQYFSDAINYAKEYESAFAGVRKTVDATEGEFSKLRYELKELATQIPLSFTELAKIMELGGQLGVKKDNLTKFTEVVAKLGTATNMTSESAAEMLAKYANIFKIDLNDIDRLGSVIVKLGNNFATTEKDVTEFSTRFAAAGKIVGMNEAEVMAVATAFSSVGVEAEAGGSAVQKVLLAMNTAVVAGGDNLKTFASTLGMTQEEFKNAFNENSTEVFQKFMQTMGTEGKQAQLILEELGLTDTRLTKAFLSMAQNTDLLTEAISMANQEREDNIALNKEAEQRYATNESKLIMLNNQYANQVEILGKGLLPISVRRKELLVGVTEAINDVLGISEATNPYIQELTGKISEQKSYLQELIQSYKDGKISLEEYTNKSLELKRNIGELEEKEKNATKQQKKLEKEYEKAVEDLNKMTEGLANAKYAVEVYQKKVNKGSGFAYWKMRASKKEVDRLTNSIEEQKEKVEQLRQKYTLSIGESDEFMQAQKAVTEKQQDLNTIMENFNNQEVKKTATIQEFENMRQKAIETIRALIELVKAEQMAGAIQNGKTGNFVAVPKEMGWSVKVPKQQNQQIVALENQLKSLENQSYKTRRAVDGGDKPSGGSKSKDDAIKKRREELEDIRDAEIQAMRESTKTEEEKFQEILKIRDKYDKEIIELEGKTQEELIKEAEEYEKERLKAIEDAAKKEEKIVQDKYKNITKEIDDLNKTIENSQKKVDDFKDKWVDDLKDMSESIRDLNHDMSELDSAHAVDMAERYVEVKKELDKPTDEKTDQEERNKLQEELNYLMKNTTEETRKTAEEYEKLSKAQKMNLKYEEEKATLAEKIAIAQAHTNSSEEGGEAYALRYEYKNDGTLMAFYKTQEGLEKEVTDYKNIQYAVDLVNKQATMEKELKDLEIQLATEQKLYVDVNNERVSMEKDFTSILSDQIEERKREQQDYTKTVEAETKKQLSIAENAALKMQEYARQYQATLASVNSFDSGSTITNNTNTTINQTINNASDMSFYNAMNKRNTQI